MKKEWELKNLSDVLQLEYGKPLPQSDRVSNGKYPVYGANGEKARSNQFYYDKPSIIVGRKGSAGEINLSEPYFWPLDVSYFVTFDDNANDLKFLYYLLTTLNLPSLARGVKPGINRNEVYSQLIRIPPLPEQKRIVKILDEAFAGIATAKANTEKNLENARALFESYLDGVFVKGGKQWKTTTLGESCNMYQPKTISKKNLIANGEYPVFGANGIIGRYDKFNHEQPQLLVTCRGATCGAINISESKSWITGNAMVIRPQNENIDLHFMKYIFQGGIDISKAITGTAQPQITRASLNIIHFSYPPLSEQKQITVKLDALHLEIEYLKSIYQQKLDKLEALKQSLLHQAFSGAL